MPKIEEMTTNQKIVDFTTATSAYVEKTAADHQHQESVKKACAALIPGVVKAMVDHQRIEPGQAEKAAAELTNPVRALEILQKLAGHRNDAEITAAQIGLGRPSGEPRPALTKKANHFVGSSTSDRSAADLAMLKHFNLPVD